MEDLSLSSPQHIFLNELNTKFRAYVGGFGSGKTYIGCLDLSLFALAHPNTRQGYFGPTYPVIRDIFYPTIDEAAFSLDLSTKINTGNKEVQLYRGRKYIGDIICRSMQDPDSIIGFKVARALVDEIDVLPKKKAHKAWEKIIARLRLKIDGVVNGIGVTCTPEGYLFAYEKFAKNPSESYSMVQASTYENKEHTPEDYISSLLETYPAPLVEAYVHGRFTNLTSGSVYSQFDRKLNDTKYVARPREAIYVGMDFNVYKMVGNVHVIRNEQAHLVHEFVNVRDTPSMVKLIQDNFRDHPVFVYPDATGKSTHTTGASVSDIRILQAAGFRVDAPPANPNVKDRVLSFNARICDGSGKRHYFVNTERCPVATDCLEQQVYDDNGEPDKKSDLDHSNDASGYFVHRRWALNRLRPTRKAGNWK